MVFPVDPSFFNMFGLLRFGGFRKGDAIRIFGSVKPQTESTFPFLYIIIFLRWESFEPPSSTPGGGGR